MSQFYCVGWVSKPHGIRGEILVRLFADRADWSSDVQSLGMSPSKAVSGQTVSAVAEILPVTRMRISAHQMIVELPAISTRNQAEYLKGRSVFISTEHMKSVSSDAPFLYELMNFSVESEEGEKLGVVSGFGSNGSQDLLVVTGPLGAFEVPFVVPLVKSHERSERRLIVSLPPGLIELNQR